MRRLTLKTCSALPLAGLLFTSLSYAEEPRKVSEPSVLREPSEVVQVVDAFDDDDLFDLNLSLGYHSTWSSAKILRESSLTDAGFSDGNYSRANLNVAQYSQRVSRLNPRADIGLYKDLALVIRLPIILSDDRELKGCRAATRIRATRWLVRRASSYFSCRSSRRPAAVSNTWQSASTLRR